MRKQMTTGAVHHLTLTVTDVNRARTFYTELLGFQQVAELGPRVLLSNGSVILALGPAPDPQQAIGDDGFDENRVGLDHLSLSVSSRADLEAAIGLFDKHGVPHGEVKDLEAFGIYVLAFRDPDNIQLELTASYP
jgi:catechol 2,3-dioxygenase-like lactoylglutathione lyase family enzyme